MERLKQHQRSIFALSAVAYFPLSEWIATAPIGTTLFIWMQSIWILAGLVAIASIPVVAVCLIFRCTRQSALHYILPVLLLPPCCFVGVLLGNRVRMSRMQAFAQRSAPVISAIERYARDHDSPPPALDSLVPGYLASVPATGMMAYPDYEYHVGADAIDRFDGNPWALTVSTPSGFISFDMMLYLPKHNYPKCGYGGGLQRLGNWAYVHE